MMRKPLKSKSLEPIRVTLLFIKNVLTSTDYNIKLILCGKKKKKVIRKIGKKTK